MRKNAPKKESPLMIEKERFELQIFMMNHSQDLENIVDALMDKNIKRAVKILDSAVKKMHKLCLKQAVRKGYKETKLPTR